MVFRCLCRFLASLLTALPLAALPAATPPPVLPGAPLGYADAADLALGAPVVARATILRADRVAPADAPGLQPGFARLYVTAHVDALIRGAGGLPTEVTYLVDILADARGKPPKVKGAATLIFAAPVPDRPGELRLVARDAQQPASAREEAVVRAVLKEALGPVAPPVVTGVGQVFHVAGTLPGDGETQIFLRTADRRPVSLSVIRHPGEEPRWAVALGDMIDDSAAPPAPGSLLWYRLACALPPALPGGATRELSADDAAAAAEDYRLVLDRLGACGRRRGLSAAAATTG